MSHPANYNVAPGAEIHLGSIMVDYTNSKASSPNTIGEVVMGGPYGEKNRTTLTDILYKVNNLLNTQSSSVFANNKYASVAVRIYRAKNTEQPATAALCNAATFIIKMLQNPGTIFQEDPSNSSNENAKGLIALPKEKIIGGRELLKEDKINEPRICPIYEFERKDTDSFPTVRTPSVQAIQIATEMANSSLWERIKLTFSPDNPEENSQKIQTMLVKGVVDIWVEFISLTPEIKKQVDAISQSSSTTAKPSTQTDEEKYYTNYNPVVT